MAMTIQDISKLSIFIWNLAWLYNGFWHGYIAMTIQDISKLSIFIWILAWLYSNDHTGYKQVEHIYLDFGMVIWQ